MIYARDLDNLYFLFSTKKIDKDEFVKKLSAILIRQRNFFGLEKMNEETLYDFIFDLYPKITASIERFDGKKGSFSSYFQGTVRLFFSNWKRQLLKSNFKEQALNSFSQFSYEQKSEENSIFEPEMKYDLSIDVEETEENGIVTCYKTKRTGEMGKPITKTEILVIMLKSVYYLNPRQISKYMKTFDIEFNEIGGLIIQAEESIEEKVRAFNTLKELTNKDFMRKEEIKLALSKLDKNSSVYLEYMELYERTCNHWKSRKEKLQKTKIIPSDRDIGRILGIPDSKVRYILRKYYRIFKINENQ